MAVEPLTENTTVRQRPTEGFRRWYVNTYFDIILWYDQPDGKLTGFQFCFSRNWRERAFTWTHDYQSSHHVSGSSDEPMGFATAILQGDGGPIPPSVVERFAQESAQMPPDVRTLILEKLNEYNARRACK